MAAPTPPPAPDPAAPAPGAPDEGVLIRAENGDVVTWDATGLVLRLSDRVVDDLRQRLGLAPADGPALLGDIDAWDLRTEGAWLRFTARLDPALGPRAYRRLRSGAADICAEPAGPLCAILALGGPRRAVFADGPPRFRFNVLAPGDDRGGVGHEGTGRAADTDRLQQLPWATREALAADALLQARAAAGQSLPLIAVRAETDTSASIAALAEGLAMSNLLAALDNLRRAAASLDRPLRVLAVALDFGIEDRAADAPALVAGMRRLMAGIEREFAVRRLPPPVFLLEASAGTCRDTAHPAIAAAAELAIRPGLSRVVVPAPGYMFAQTPWGRLTDDGLRRAARMDALALEAVQARRPWTCPTLLLAEAEGRRIRVIAQAMAPLVLCDGLAAGPLAGFALTGCDARLRSVAIDPADPLALILTTDRDATGGTLHYAHGAPPQPGRSGLPPNVGGLRDDWQAADPDGPPLHRWALSAVLPIRRGP